MAETVLKEDPTDVSVIRSSLGAPLNPNVTQLINIGYASFEQDPHIKNMLGHGVSDEEYNKNRLKGFNIILREWCRVPEKKIVLSDESGLCFAMWSKGKPQFGFMAKLRIAIKCIFAIGGRLAKRFGEFDDAVAEKHPTNRPHMYLDMMATMPEGQGKGIGSRVMRQMTEYFDEHNIAAYTWSSNPKNVPFYLRHGFVIMEQPMSGLPKDATILTSLWRDPKPSQQTTSS